MDAVRMALFMFLVFIVALAVAAVVWAVVA
jgi:hypothetical protein